MANLPLISRHDENYLDTRCRSPDSPRCCSFPVCVMRYGPLAVGCQSLFHLNHLRPSSWQACDTFTLPNAFFVENLTLLFPRFYSPVSWVSGDIVEHIFPRSHKKTVPFLVTLSYCALRPLVQVCFLDSPQAISWGGSPPTLPPYSPSFHPFSFSPNS